MLIDMAGTGTIPVILSKIPLVGHAHVSLISHTIARYCNLNIGFFAAPECNSTIL